MTSSPLTVSKLTAHLVRLFEQDDALRDVQVVGEVSNWKRAASGHIYFRLKDAGATINAVMWKGSALAHGWLPRDGDQVIAHGYIGVYPESGAYQLYANRLLPAGKGQLYAQFERSRNVCAAAGLFDAERKRPIPALPQRIGDRDQPRCCRAARHPARVGRTLAVGGSDRLPDVGAGRRRTAAHRRRHRDRQPLQRRSGRYRHAARGARRRQHRGFVGLQRRARRLCRGGQRHPHDRRRRPRNGFHHRRFCRRLCAPTPSAAAAAAVPSRDEVRSQIAAYRQMLLQRATALAQERAPWRSSTLACTASIPSGSWTSSASAWTSASDVCTWPPPHRDPAPRAPPGRRAAAGGAQSATRAGARLQHRPAGRWRGRHRPGDGDAEPANGRLTVRAAGGAIALTSPSGVTERSSI